MTVQKTLPAVDGGVTVILSRSWENYRAAVTRNDFLGARLGLDSGSAIGRW